MPFAGRRARDAGTPAVDRRTGRRRSSETSWTHTLRVLGRVVPDETRVYRINSAHRRVRIRVISPATTAASSGRTDARHLLFPRILRRASSHSSTRCDRSERFETTRKETPAQIELTRGNVRASYRVSLEEPWHERPSDRRNAANPPRSDHTDRHRLAGGRLRRRQERFARTAIREGDGVLPDRGPAPRLDPGGYLRERNVVFPARCRPCTVTLPNQEKDIHRESERRPSPVRRRHPDAEAAPRRWTIPASLLRPDMFVDVDLAGHVSEGHRPYPSMRSVDSGLRKTVFVDLGKGYFEPRGRRDRMAASGDRVEIVKGLMPGERIVVSGNFLIDSESRMKAAAAGTPGSGIAAKKEMTMAGTVPVHVDPVCGDGGQGGGRRRFGKNRSEYQREELLSSVPTTARFEFRKDPGRYAEKAASDAPHEGGRSRGRTAMINRIIDFSVKNKAHRLHPRRGRLRSRGGWSMKHVPLDAIPDLSDTQVIIYSRWDRSPDIIEDQVTYPIVTAMLGAPQGQAVRGFSDFGYSYVYVIFEDGTDIYWARSRTLEYLSGVLPRLPAGREDRNRAGCHRPRLDLPVRPGRYHRASTAWRILRSYQDWYLRYHLKSVPGVAEVAPLGGFRPAIPGQRRPEPAAGLRHSRSAGSSRRCAAATTRRAAASSSSAAPSTWCAAGATRSRSRTSRTSSSRPATDGTPIRIKDVGEVVRRARIIRRGVADLDGEGEAVSGIVVMRQGQNALEVIDRVKAKIREIEPGLPDGREDRPDLRPLGPDPPLDRQPEVDADRSDRHRRRS